MILMALVFGTAGIPLGAKGLGIIDGIRAVGKLGLGAMELEFVYSVNVSEKLAPKVKASADSAGVVLTCHAPYYINLNAADMVKLDASKARLVRAAFIADKCGAKSVAFHPGFYMGAGKDAAYGAVKSALADVVEKVGQLGCRIVVRPETTGKHTQFGSLGEVLRLSQEIGGVQPCIDYAHLRARDGINDKEGFAMVLGQVEAALGRSALDAMHIQFSGVKFSEKGELSHLPLSGSDLDYQNMVQSWRDFNISGVVISESPEIEGDALLLKGLYENG